MMMMVLVVVVVTVGVVIIIIMVISIIIIIIISTYLLTESYSVYALLFCCDHPTALIVCNLLVNETRT